MLTKVGTLFFFKMRYTGENNFCNKIYLNFLKNVARLNFLKALFKTERLYLSSRIIKEARTRPDMTESHSSK